MGYRLFVYTRTPDDKFCLPEFGNSIHFAVSEDGGTPAPFNQNGGVLYAKAEISEKNEIIGKSLAEPVICKIPQENGSGHEYAILAKRIEHDGQMEENRDTERLLWLTKDFMSFQECGMVHTATHLRLKNMQEEGTECSEPPFPDAVSCHCIEIGQELYEKLVTYYTPLHNTHMDIPRELTVSSSEAPTNISFMAHYSDGSSNEDPTNISFMAYYSDGSSAVKKYELDTSQVDFEHPGTYSVTAHICQKPYAFPLATGFADPVIFLWNDKYYYISTNDNTDDVGFWVREAERVEDLFRPDTEQHLILDKNPEKKLIQTFWAPEFHVIGGRVYILFAVSGDTFDPQCHMMRLKENGSITRAEDWEDPVRVRRMDGTFLAEKGISLDMTHFSANGKSYLVWSYRENCMAEGDTGSMLFIASTDTEQPWRLTSEPVLLSRPLYGWENVAGTINNEGPYPLVTENKIYLAYSGGSACNWTYTVGMLSIDPADDPLELQNWEKSPYPVLCTADLHGVYGPGHNSFFRDKDGDTYIAYHGEITPYDSPRSTMLHRVHFRTNGDPVFNLCYERDVKEEYREITLPLVNI